MVLRRYKQFLAYINKDDFDHMQGSINPIDYHSTFIFFANLFSMMDYEVTPMWMYISPTCTALSAIIAGSMFSISIAEYVRILNIHLITECGTYLLVMVYKLLVVYSIISGKTHFHNLLQALRDDFHYICTTGQKYREKFFENQRLTFKASVLVSIFVGSVGGGVSVLACVSVVVAAFQNKEAGAERPLPYPFYLFGYNLNTSPTYEIIFAASVLFTFFHTYVYIFFLQSAIIWIREITCKADIITWNLQDILVDISPAKNNEEKEYYNKIIKHRMREVIEMHHAMYKLTEGFAAVYKNCLLFEQIVSSTIICLTTFSFTEKCEAGEIQLILLVLCIAVIVVVLVPCYLCTHLLEKVQSVSDVCWDTPFWNAGPVIGPYMVLIMQRSMRQLPIAAAGFDDISLQTFANMMTRAYSYFNILRKADFDLS